jgi:hypothetical protein
MQQLINEKLIKNGYSGNAGLYVSVIPNKRSKNIIKAVADVLGMDCNVDELHCTLMYSKYDAPKTKDVFPKTKTFRAIMQDIKVYGKDKDALVITMESDDLSKEHERLKSLGAVHSWEFFQPHVTIQTFQADKPFDDFYLDNVIDSINGREIIFNGYSWDDLAD